MLSKDRLERPTFLLATLACFGCSASALNEPIGMPTFHTGFSLQPNDARGLHLKPGDLVKILVIPDSLTRDLPTDGVSLLRS
jgi:hypothetical protein